MCNAFDAYEKGKVTDKSGKKNDGKVYGAKWIQGAMQFDGKGNYIGTPWDASFESVAYSVAVFVKPVDTKEEPGWGRSIVSQAESNKAFYRNIVVKDGRFQVVYSCGPDNYFLMSKERFVPGQWYHVVSTYDGKRLALYVNGVLAGDVNFGPLSVSKQRFDIGGRNDTPSEFFHGAIGEVMV